MRTLWVKCLTIVVCLCLTSAGFSMEVRDSLSYPPEPPKTSIKEMADAGKGLAKEIKELGQAMIRGIEHDGGIIATFKKHKKFYGGIFVFAMLCLVWLKTRDK